MPNREPRDGAVRALIKSVALGAFSRQTLKGLQLDLLRMRARAKRIADRDVVPLPSRIHLGCGRRRVAGWLNVDVAGSDYDVDLGCGRLPWQSGSAAAVVSQQVVEHLELESEFLPLLQELRRVLRPGGELWIACPDMEKICRSYIEHRGADLLDDKRVRYPDYSLGEVPTQHMINVFFQQGGQHKNLYDFGLLDWALRRSGFATCERKVEQDLLDRYPGFPERQDDYHSIYIRARA